MFLEIFLLLTAYVFSFPLQGVVITCNETPSLLFEPLQTLQTNHTNFLYLEYSHEALIFLENSPPNFIVDATFSLYPSYRLSLLSNSLKVILIKIGKPEQDSYTNEWKFFSSPSLNFQTEALHALIDFFDWEAFHVFSSEKISSRDAAENFKKENKQKIYDEFLNVLSETLIKEVYVDYIGRLIKPSGNWKLLIFNENSEKIIEALEEMKMLKKGCGVILNFSGLSSVKKGMIIVAEEGTESSSDLYDFQVKELELTIDLIENTALLFRNQIDNKKLLEGLSEHTENGGRIPKFLILNSHEEDYFTQIGKIEDSTIIISGNLTLPGGQTNFTNDLLEIQYSQNSGYINHLGEFDYGNYIAYGAIELYIDIINEDDSQLENFKIVPTEVDCGSRYFYYDYFKQCFEGFRDSLGLFYLHSASEVTYDTVQLFREMEIKVSQIGQYPQNNDLYLKEFYPEIVLSTTHRSLMFGFLPNLLIYNGWKNIITFETQKYYDNGVSESFYKNCESNRITIHNSEETQVFPDYYTTDKDFDTYKEYFEDFYNSGVRVFVLQEMWNEFMYIVESLYKVGFRKGDIQILCIYDPLLQVNTFETNFDENELYNIKSLLSGAIWVSQGEYVDEFEYTLKPLVEEVLAPNSIDNSCYPMDMLELGAYAVDNLLITGRDYENEFEVNESMRVQRFKGCSGTFSIDSSSNERRDFLYFIGYTVFDLKTGEGYIEKPGKYSAVENPLMIIEGEFEYSNESTSPPEDMRYEEWICDFLKEIVEWNSKSKAIQIGLTSSILGVSFILFSVLIWIFRERDCFKLSEEQDIMGLDDLLVILSIIFENMQHLMIGPDLSTYNPLFSYFGNYLAIHLVNIYTWQFESFWVFYKVFIGISSLWIVLLLAYFMSFVTRLNEKFRLYFKDLGENKIPGLAHIFFIPVMMVLFEVMFCEKGISEDEKESFMNRDCDTFCWEGTHTDYVIASSVLIVAFTVSTLTYRTIYSEYTYKNVKIQPIYNYIKGIFQIVLVLLSIAIKNQFSLVFNIIFSLLMMVYFGISCKLLVYNHKRIKLMQVFSILAIIWSILLTTIFELITAGDVNLYTEIVFSVLQFLGWTLMLVAFFYMYRKEPKVFLKSEAKYGVMDLFKFMFGKKDLKQSISRVSQRYKEESEWNYNSEAVDKMNTILNT